MRFRLEMQNVGTGTVQYDPQQVAVNASMIVIGPDGKERPYVAQYCQTQGSPKSLKVGDRAVLFDNLDVAAQYLMTKPGQYVIQFRGDHGPSGEVDIPPSDRVTIQVGDGPVQPAHAIAARLIRVVPSAQWWVSIANQGDVTPKGRSPAEGVHIYALRHGSSSRDRVFVHIWVTKEPTETNAGRSPTPAYPVATYLGRCEFGHVYVCPDKEATELWADMTQSIKRALDITTP